MAATYLAASSALYQACRARSRHLHVAKKENHIEKLMTAAYTGSEERSYYHVSARELRDERGMKSIANHRQAIGFFLGII